MNERHLNSQKPKKKRPFEYRERGQQIPFIPSADIL